MIAMTNQLPMILWENERSVPLSEGWLMESIEWTANRAGYPQWEWTQDIVKALTYYLEEEYATMTISRNELEGLMDVSIKSIGYPEIAAHAGLVAPRVSIYLPDLARECPWELAFFQELGERLQEAGEVVVRGIKLSGIRPCVKQLRGAQRWHPRCQHLSDEIVAYTRQIIMDWNRPAIDLMIH
jgi:hypothetical protein